MPNANEDNFEVEILEDGTIKLSSDKISAANHMNAEQLIRNIQTLTGGKATRAHKGVGKAQETQHSQQQKQ